MQRQRRLACAGESLGGLNGSVGARAEKSAGGNKLGRGESREGEARWNRSRETRGWRAGEKREREKREEGDREREEWKGGPNL